MFDNFGTSTLQRLPGAIFGQGIADIDNRITDSREMATDNIYVDGQIIRLPGATYLWRTGSLLKFKYWGDTQHWLDFNPIQEAVVGAMNQWASITTSAMLTTASFMAPVPKLGLGGSAGRAMASPTGRYYSVAYETRLASSSYPGVSRYMHFKEANISLNKAINSNESLGGMMNSLGVSVPRSPTGAILGKSPKNWVWHHSVEKGVMQLVPKSQHPSIPGGLFWETMHPRGVGGYSIWGR